MPSPSAIHHPLSILYHPLPSPIPAPKGEGGGRAEANAEPSIYLGHGQRPQRLESPQEYHQIGLATPSSGRWPAPRSPPGSAVGRLFLRSLPSIRNHYRRGICVDCGPQMPLSRSPSFLTRIGLRTGTLSSTHVTVQATLITRTLIQPCP